MMSPATYNAKVDAAVRVQVELTKNCVDNPSAFPPPSPPDTLIRYAVDKHTKRMNDASGHANSKNLPHAPA